MEPEGVLKFRCEGLGLQGFRVLEFRAQGSRALRLGVSEFSLGFEA